MKNKYETGELWSDLETWRSKGFLMGLSSHRGKDTHMSELGLAYGHAYSILDVCEIDGHKLV